MVCVTRVPLARMPLMDRAASASRLTLASVCAEAPRRPAPMGCMRLEPEAVAALGKRAGRIYAILFFASNS